VRAALRKFLSAFPGFDVVGDAGNATTAMQLARERTPTVVLVDVLLPDAEDGLGLLHALADELRIPAVAISMHWRLRCRALAVGALELLAKTVRPSFCSGRCRPPHQADRASPSLPAARGAPTVGHRSRPAQDIRLCAIDRSSRSGSGRLTDEFGCDLLHCQR
jgi:CheY-like chemotaxis protein